MILLLAFACAPPPTAAPTALPMDADAHGAEDALVPPDPGGMIELAHPGGTQHVWVAMDGLYVEDANGSNAMEDRSFVIDVHWGQSAIDFPSWTSTPGERDALMRALSDRFDGYDIRFHRDRPDEPVYTTLVMTDYATGPVHGVAPVDCGNTSRNDIAWVYKAQQSSQQWLHNAAAHELGHSFGLAHVLNDLDPMYWTTGDGDFSVSALDADRAAYHCLGNDDIQDGPAMLELALGLADSPPPYWDGSFADDDGNTHEAAIEAIATEGITLGCDSTPVPRFCPDAVVTRGQMVVFLRRALGLPASPTDHFSDDDGRFYEDAANAAADAGITYGCGDDDFCGERAVTRAEMASFLARAFDYPPSGADHFTDDDDSIHEESIDRIADAGVTYGCGNGAYCPDDPVRRDQMASFLARALNL